MTNPSFSRRVLLQKGAAVAALAVFQPALSVARAQVGAKAPSMDIRPFHVDIPQDALEDLRRRLSDTRWPEAETVDDRSQGVNLARLRELADYWETGYDWRKAEAKLNAVPQFVTEIDGLDVHFIHVRSRHADALPLIMTHGWPGSIFEFLNTLGPLTDPTAYGGSAEDAFHLVLPSIPGFGFSEKPVAAGWTPARIGRAWDILMRRLGYDRYVAQGGDWGAIITDAMGAQAPEGLIGIHVNRIERATTLPPEIARALKSGEPAPAGLSDEEKAVFDDARDFLNKGFGYAAIMGTRPQTMGYGLVDSPVALAAWIYDKLADWVFTRGNPELSLDRDAMLDNITLYWLTSTGASSARIYWENGTDMNKAAEINVPAAVTIFPGEVYKPPKDWAERFYKKLVYYNEVDKGGHFAAWEEPELFSTEIRAAFSSMR
ncbi:epoxide hydrolase [Rhizobiaceae bacterium n13]|uniref:Epoxide hydrolase n=2 Tax=Ferirhizobium litorale TaxID=2927786 RepID=A0AAE3QAF1_9HYPH|nr:epoxide hydrolase [Fererhizobium litorale]MDI7864651.1 epoxide hydrolase [Fererhizobium litorale]MDI7922142.1 epoxide hydrolase [Fererhizobium litorale]